MAGYAQQEVLERSEHGVNGESSEKDVFQDRLLTVLDEALPGCGTDERRTYDLRVKFATIPPMIGQAPRRGEVFEPEGDHEWPVLHDHDRIPDGVGLYPQIFIVPCGKGNPDIRNGEYAAAIDRHLKYIHVPGPYRDYPELTGIPGGVLNKLAVEWEAHTAYGGQYHNPAGEDVDLDTVKFLE